MVDQPATPAANAVIAAAGVLAAVAPVVSPIVVLVMAIIRAHQNATNGQFPTAAQVQAALPADTAEIHSIWGDWTANHPG